MYVIKLFLILLSAVCIFCTVGLEAKFMWKFTKRKAISCEDSGHDCEECLLKESCSWCGEDSASSSSCIPSEFCPRHLQQPSCPNTYRLESQLESLVLKNQVRFDVPQVTLNASYVCHKRRSCITCKGLEFCAWCSEKNLCIPYFGALTTSLCGSKQWTRDSCISPVSQAGNHHAKPCHERRSGCEECVADEACYWCDNLKHCGYYQGGAKPNCTVGSWYYKQCTHRKVLIVLIPIIVILFTPFVAYLVMYCIICAMKKSGYNAITNSDTSDDEGKVRKPIMLRHDSFESKTDKLRDKYGLSKRP